MSSRDFKSMCKLIGIMLILYAPFWLMFRANADTLAMTYPHLEEASPYAATSPRSWYQDITIELDSTATPALREAVMHAAWQWSQRTGKRISVSSGTGPAGHARSGRITVGMAYVESIGQTQSWFSMDTGNITGVIVKMNPLHFNGYSDCLQHAVTHEIGHAIGGTGHTASKSDVMYPHQTHCQYALSSADVGHVPYDGNTCFVELTKDYSLYIPDYQGHAALLKYTGSGWKLAEHLPSSGKCSTVFELDMNLTFGDIRSISGNYRAQLRYMGNETWTLDYVE